MSKTGLIFLPQKILNIILVALILLFPFLGSSSVSAASKSLMISQLQTGGAGSGNAGQEFMELHNSSSEDLDINGWKVIYSSYSDGTNSTLAELAGGIRAGGFILLASSSMQLPENLEPDFAFLYSGGISANGGHIKTVDSLGQEIDRLGWGTAQFAETNSAPAPPAGSSLVRIVNEQNILQDTDNNFTDFATAENPEPKTGGWFDLQPEPESYLPVEITELLPNPGSPKTDAEHEFIELYNPNDTSVNLLGYEIQAGSSYGYKYILPGIELPPKSYLALYSADTKITLSNSTGRARILDPLKNIVSETDLYQNAADDKSWALIGQEWRFTEKPTSGSANILSETIESPGASSGSNLKPCRSDQFRNPETNRCKLIVTNSSNLKPCLAGQYRNPATNRCKSLAVTVSSLTPCKVGQFRNPETNRCKKLESGSSLAPCKEGQERNPETNRCRKAVAANAQVLGQDKSSDKKQNTNALVLAVVGSLLIGWGVWEYRQEITQFGRKLTGRSKRKL